MGNLYDAARRRGMQLKRKAQRRALREWFDVTLRAIRKKAQISREQFGVPTRKRLNGRKSLGLPKMAAMPF